MMDKALQFEAAWDPESWDRIVTSYSKRMRAYLKKVPCSPDERHEILLDAWAIISESHAALDSSQDPWPLIHSSLKAICAERMRRWRREVPFEERHDVSLNPSADVGERLGCGEELRELLRKTFLRLPRTERRAVALKHLHGWTYAQIAGRLGTSEGAARVAVHRGLRKLRKEIQSLRDSRSITSNYTS